MQIEFGGTYRRRDGEIVGPATRSAFILRCWQVGDYAYPRDGAFDFIGRGSHPFDLVAEAPSSASPDDIVSVGW